jgi:hypothetical protein
MRLKLSTSYSIFLFDKKRIKIGKTTSEAKKEEDEGENVIIIIIIFFYGCQKTTTGVCATQLKRENLVTLYAHNSD